MNSAKSWSYILPFVRARWLGGRIPLVVGIQITTRCNLRCAYCARWNERPVDLATDLLSALFVELHALGTRRVVLTGGEPLVRADLGEILARATSLGLRVGVNTNGTLVARRLDDLAGIRDAALSLDGTGEAHDKLRGAGTFDLVSRAGEELRRRGVRVRYTVVLHRAALDEVDPLLALGSRQQIPILFQPLFNPAPEGESWAPAETAYRAAIDRLIAAKRGALGPIVANSLTGLLYLREWPRLRRASCAGGLLFCRVQANGDVVICAEHPRPAGNIVAAGPAAFREAFEALATGECGTCPCANHVEINQAFRLHPEAALNLFRLL